MRGQPTGSILGAPTTRSSWQQLRPVGRPLGLIRDHPHCPSPLAVACSCSLHAAVRGRDADTNSRRFEQILLIACSLTSKNFGTPDDKRREILRTAGVLQGPHTRPVGYPPVDRPIERSDHGRIFPVRPRNGHTFEGRDVPQVNGLRFRVFRSFSRALSIYRPHRAVSGGGPRGAL